MCIRDRDYKDQIVRALTGLPCPSWLNVVRIRKNSSGYHIRITGKVKDEASALFYRSLAEHRGAMIACGDGTCLLYTSGMAFRRARLKSAYSVLRGKDMETEVFSEELRDTQFAKLKEAQAHVLNLTHWHDYLGVLRQSGFTGGNLISSQTTIYYTCLLYTSRCV